MGNQENADAVNMMLKLTRTDPDMVLGEYMMVHLCVLFRGVRDEGVHFSL